jgi:hypothetical protein
MDQELVWRPVWAVCAAGRSRGDTGSCVSDDRDRSGPWRRDTPLKSRVRASAGAALRQTLRFSRVATPSAAGPPSSPMWTCVPAKETGDVSQS